MSFQHPSPPTTRERAGKVRFAPALDDDTRPDTGSPQSLPRHLAPSQRRPGLIRSLLSAFLLVVVVLAVGAVVILSSINRVENPPGSASPPTAAPPPPVRNAPARSEPLLREGSFESGSTGAVHNQRGSMVELVAGVGAESAYSVRLSSVGPPFGRAGLQVDRVARPLRLGSRYNATVQVKGVRDQLVQIRLVESFGGQRVSATATNEQLSDTSWHEVVVQHQIKTDGSLLGVEVTVTGIRPGQFVWVDNLQVTQTR